MTIATTTFLKLNQSHFNQGIDYMPTPSPSENSDYYQHHHFPSAYHFVAHQCYPGGHMCSTPSPHCDHHYGATSKSGKSYATHTYQAIVPSTISSSTLQQEHQYAKPDNMGNIEIINSKKLRCYDEMNNEI
jgi:hypothetical protein